MTFNRAMVTGVAGFVGSSIAQALLDADVEVIGVDCLTDYYDLAIKQRHLDGLTSREGFTFHQVDLAVDELNDLVDGAGVIFHQAAKPGVRASWSDGFVDSVTNNVTATQRLLEAARQVGIDRLVYASSSSVYGEASEIPMREDGPLRPYSPYGVTKLSAEQLCTVYASNFGLPTVSLRYFTVYGPRQRPDMATHRLIQAALNGTVFPLFGASGHVRDFTFIGDIVAANLAAARAAVDPGTIVNVAGGAIITMDELMVGVEQVTGRTLNVDDQGKKAGDVSHTQADLTKVHQVLEWAPQVALVDGLAAQVAWHQDHQDVLSPSVV